MNPSRLFALFVLLLVGIPAVAADLPASAVCWSLDRPLSWGDFRCSPPANASSLIDVAAIHMTIQWSASFTIRTQPGGSIWVGTVDRLTVINLMDPARSWALQTRATSQALCHEQTHFNLNEVYRRKLEAALCAVQATGPTSDAAQATLQQRLHQTADALLDRLAEIQAQYDRETRHGTDAATQAAWDQRVAEWLQHPECAP